MPKLKSSEVATVIVNEIFKDLRDRRTLKWLFAEHPSQSKIDDDTQAEIHSRWVTIIRVELKKVGVLE